MSKPEKAVIAFKSWLNCAQSVVSVYTDEMKFDRDLSLQISSGFGAGMGRLQETCGAVTGAFMMIGLYNSNKYKNVAEGKEASIKMIQNFSKKFEKEHGTLKCSVLLKCDLNTKEGQNYFSNNQLGEKICEKCVANSVEILDTLLIKK